MTLSESRWNANQYGQLDFNLARTYFQKMVDVGMAQLEDEPVIEKY